MKTAAFILEEEDIYSEAGANGVTLTLHDLLRHGLTEYNAIVVGKWCHTPFPSAEFIHVRSQKRRDYIDGISSVISKIKAGVIIVPQSFRFALLAKKLRPETPCLLYRHNLVRPKVRISTLLFRSRIKKSMASYLSATSSGLTSFANIHCSRTGVVWPGMAFIPTNGLLATQSLEKN